MDMALYITLATIACALFGYGVIRGMKEEQIGLSIVSMIMSMVMFLVVGYSSLAITIVT